MCNYLITRIKRHSKISLIKIWFRSDSSFMCAKKPQYTFVQYQGTIAEIRKKPFFFYFQNFQPINPLNVISSLCSSTYDTVNSLYICLFTSITVVLMRSMTQTRSPRKFMKQLLQTSQPKFFISVMNIWMLNKKMTDRINPVFLTKKHNRIVFPFLWKQIFSCLIWNCVVLDSPLVDWIEIKVNNSS